MRGNSQFGFHLEILDAAHKEVYDLGLQVCSLICFLSCYDSFLIKFGRLLHCSTPLSEWFDAQAMLIWTLDIKKLTVF